MSTAIPLQRGGLWHRTADFVELTKPRISVLVLVTVTVSGFVATWGQPNLWLLMHALIGTTLIAASASGFNQWLERDRDSIMSRTADRPLPAGRMTGAQAVAFSSVCLVAGLLYLILQVNWASTLCAFLTWFFYVCLYTPLKTTTWLNTVVGALSGAMPVLIGWFATGGQADPRLDPRGAALFVTLFLWQFPHFMAIAWIYRHEYRKAGYQMLTVVDPSGRRPGVQAVLAALALLPVSFVPALVGGIGTGAVLYLIVVFTLGVIQLGFSWRFLIQPSQQSARGLLRVSLIYLPCLLGALVVIPIL